MKRPLTVLSLIFCLGIISANTIRVPFAAVYSLSWTLLSLGILSHKKGLSFNIFLLGLMFLLGGALQSNSRTLPKCHISRYAYYKNNNLYCIRGLVESACLMKNNRTSFIFSTREIQLDSLRYNCCGNILVYLKGEKNFSYGDELILRGNLCRPYRFGGSRRGSYRDYLYRQGIFSIMQAQTIRVLGRGKAGVLKRFSLWSKEKMEALLFKYLSNLSAGILDAMVLGEKRNIPAIVYNSMIKSGTVHILVVSGFNVGVVAFMIILFLKLIRCTKRARFYIAVPLVIFYCLITGASTPVVRATVMALVFMFGLFIKREPDIYNALSVAALFILGANPAQLFDTGFQLSFISVISIVCLYPKIRSFLRIDALNNKYARYFIDSCLVSFSAWLGTAGFIAYYFKIFSPITVFANLFIVPLATLITLCGFSLIMLGLILPALAHPFASSCELLVTFLLGINTFLVKLPGAYLYLP